MHLVQIRVQMIHVSNLFSQAGKQELNVIDIFTNLEKCQSNNKNLNALSFFFSFFKLDFSIMAIHMLILFILSPF